MKQNHNENRSTNTPPRNTLRNFVKLVSSGNFLEILKVFRRRLLNSLKVFRRAWGVVYDQPVFVRRRQRRHLNHTLSKYYSYSNKKKAANQLKVALIIKDGTTYPKSSAFIRLIGPLTSAGVSDKISIELYPENTTRFLKKVDVAIVQRTAFDSEGIAKKFVDNMRATNIPIVIDSDDAFHSVDPFHPERHELKDKAAALNFIFSEANQIWLSTEALKSYLSKTKHEATVVPNTLDRRLWKAYNQKSLQNKPLQLLYMGTVSHDADLAMIMPALDKLAEKYPGAFELTIIGVASDTPEHPWIKRLYQKRGGSIYPKFVEWFLKQGPFDIGLSPLVDTPFNQSKSDIKCLDYLAAGILPIVSDVRPYSSSELDDYIIRVKNSEKAWEEKLEESIKDPGNFRKRKSQIIPRAQKYLWHKRSSEIAAKKLLEQLKELRKS